MNTSEGTVKGQLEGTQNELNEMYVNDFNFPIYCNKIIIIYFLGNTGYRIKVVLAQVLTKLYLVK